eukprot:jgi/Astpho2/1063/Aster-x0980
MAVSLTWGAREDLRHMEGLGQEALDLASARHGAGGAGLSRRLWLPAVVMAAVILHSLHRAGGVVVLLPQDAGTQHARGGVQGVHCGVDAQLSDGAGQHSRRVQGQPAITGTECKSLVTLDVQEGSPRSVASVGWYPTAEGMRPSSADTSELA